MARYAVVDDNRVTALIESDGLDETNWVAIGATDEITIGQYYDGSKFLDRDPSRLITADQFRRRFTLEERIEIEEALPNHAPLRVMEKDLMNATHVDLDLDENIMSLNYLAANGIIAKERVAEILK